jgi:hypothetical protein
VGFFLKGMCLSIRNPRSHSIYSDSKENADKIIILIDYLYSFISSSKQNVLIDDWVEFLKSDAFPTDLEYAKLLIKQVSKHNSINIIIEILKNINKFNIDKINNFFKILLSTLSSSDNIILVDYINKLLINENHGFNLIPYFSLLNNEIWTKLDKIVTLKMERAIIDTLFSNEEIYHYSEDGKYLEKSNLYYLIKSIEPYLEIFDNKEEIYDGLFLKTLKDDIRVYIRILSDFRNIFYSDYFVFEYNSFMGNMIDNIRKDIKNKLNPSLDIAKSKVYKVRDSKWIKTFLEDIEKINNSSEAKNGDLPF